MSVSPVPRFQRDNEIKCAVGARIDLESSFW
jgi:hypothetical protein